MKPTPRSTTTATSAGCVRNSSPVTKDGIKTMLWSTYNNKYSSSKAKTKTKKRPSIVVQLMQVVKLTGDDDGDNDNPLQTRNKQKHHHQPQDEAESNSAYALFLSDDEFKVTAIVEENAFQKMIQTNNSIRKIPSIDDIPIKTYICVDDYRPTFLSDYKHCIFIKSFRIHSFYHNTSSRSAAARNEESSLLEEVPFVDDWHSRSDITVLKWAEWIKDNTNVDELQHRYLFKSRNLGYNETRVLVDALRVNTTLRAFNYSGNRMGNTGMEYLVDVLEHDNKAIKYLDLSENNITYPGVKAMAMYLQQNPSIGNVQLCNNTVGGRGGKILASVLERHNTKLRYLNLTSGKVSTCGIVALAKMLKSNRTLLSLLLSHNKISDDGVCALATSLWYNHTLQILNLSHNEIGPSGVTALGKVLKYNTGLIELQIQRNNIRETVGILPIYQALEYNSTLEQLSHGRMLPGRGAPERNDPTTQRLQNEYNRTIQNLMEYNDTLERITNLDLPRFIKKIDLRTGRSYPYGYIVVDDDDDDDSTTSTDRVAPKKGQRQKHDVYNWLYYGQQDWPIIIMQQSTSEDCQERRRSKRLQTESSMVVNNNNKKSRF